MSRKSFIHNRQCAYCISKKVPPETFVVPGSPTVTGCRHYRGGKSFRKHLARKLANAALKTQLAGG